MKQLAEHETVLRRFLLGELPPAEQEEVEERLFSDPEFFKQFQAAEDELIDEYLYGDLSAGERERFTQFFITTSERRESLRVAKALQKYNSKKAAHAAAAESVGVPHPRKISFLAALLGRSPALRFTMAAAALLLLAVSAWVVVRYALRDGPGPSPIARQETPQPPTPQTAPGQPTPGATPSAQEPAAPTPPVRRDASPSDGAENVRKDGSRKATQPPPTEGLYSFIILPVGQVRGGGGPEEVPLPADARVMRLQLPLIDENGASQYQVALQTEAGAEVNVWPRLRPVKTMGGHTIVIDVPAATITPQTYRVVIREASGGRPPQIIQTFQFKVIRPRL